MDQEHWQSWSLEPGLKRGLETARTMEDEALHGFQYLVERWCDRRHRMLEAYSRFGEVSVTARTPQDWLQAWVELSSGAMERLSEDARDQMEAGAAAWRSLTWGREPLIGGGTASSGLSSETMQPNRE